MHDMHVSQVSTCTVIVASRQAAGNIVNHENVGLQQAIYCSDVHACKAEDSSHIVAVMPEAHLPATSAGDTSPC